MGVAGEEAERRGVQRLMLEIEGGGRKRERRRMRGGREGALLVSSASELCMEFRFFVLFVLFWEGAFNVRMGLENRSFSAILRDNLLTFIINGLGLRKGNKVYRQSFYFIISLVLFLWEGRFILICS
jgi:hypothetical protein